MQERQTGGEAEHAFRIIASRPVMPLKQGMMDQNLKNVEVN